MGSNEVGAPVGPRVLVVAEDEALRGLVVQALGLEGMAARGAGGPVQALALCRGSAPFSVVVLDWRPDDPTGPAFAADYRALPPPHAPLVLLTAPGDAVDMTERTGARGFVTKPFDLQDLVETVQRCLPAGTAPRQSHWHN